jgi:HlyD family secretion protein
MVRMRTRIGRRAAVWGGIGLIIVGAGVVAMMPRRVPVDLTTIGPGPLTVTIDHEGQTRVRERFVVSAPLPGRVQRIELRPGDRVIANETVVATFVPMPASLLDPRSRAEAHARVKGAEAALERAQAERDQASAQREHADAEQERARGLFAAGLTTLQTRQTAETEALVRQRVLDGAESAVRAAADDVEVARAALIEPGRGGADAGGSRAVLTLRSPIDGVVLRRLRESEAVVPQGEALLEVADLSALEIIADYLSTDAVRIRAGMLAFVEQWGGGAPLRAKVDRVEPAGFLKVSALGVEEQRVWVVLALEDPRAAWQTLGDGYRVEARVVVWEQPDSILAPTSSLFRRGDGWAVFVVDGGVAHVRSVVVGERNGASAEVTSGLVPGERVIVYPPDGIDEGVRISER